jgi:peptidoglycan/xylan/chitin deacetylase (PgdA/CDA1 family)
MDQNSLHPAFRLTTSWDDGHPLDLRLAEMLDRHKLPATFYIPRHCPPRKTLTESQVRELSTRFEIGAHTINHVFLTEAADDVAQREIVDSKKWVEEITARPCRMFCPPAGKFAAKHAGWIRHAGYTGFRTVELLSLSPPRRRPDGLIELSTAVHAFPHGGKTYIKNALRRRSAGNLWRYIVHGSGDWEAVSHSLLARAAHTGGHFHLWGHSWEIEETAQWDRLERVLAMLAPYAQPETARTNGELCAESEIEAKVRTPAA